MARRRRWAAPPPDDGPTRVLPRPTAAHPALVAAVVFATGVYLHDRLPVAVWLWIAFAACYGLAAVLARRAVVSTCCLVIGVAAIGVAAGQSARYSYEDGEIGLYTGETPRLAWLELHLPTTPKLVRLDETPVPRPPRLTTVAEVRRVKTHDGWTPATGTVLLRFDQPVPTLAAGQRVRVFGTLERPGAAMNLGQFDFAAYYRGRRTLASVGVDGPANVTILNADPPSPLTRLRESARRSLLAGFTAQQADEAALLRTLLLGDADPAMSDDREIFRKSGTSHHLAVSGLHVAVIGGLAFFLARLLGAGPRLSLVAFMAVVAGYALLATPSPPVLRAVVLSLAFGLGLVSRRRGAGLNLLGVAAIVVLWLNPLDLYRAGFQLTFAVVLGLMLLSDAASAAMARHFGHESKSDLKLQSDPWLIRWTHYLDRRMIAAVAAGVVAWVVATPLVAAHFEQFNPWAIPASLAVAPLVLLSLVGGVLKLLLTAAMPGLAEFWAMLAAWPVSAMRWAVAQFAAMPGAEVPLPAPTPTLIVGFYLALILWRLPLPTPGLRWAARGPLAVSAWLIFVVPFTSADPDAAARGPLRVTMLAVGAGQCSAVETPAGRLALVDVGSTSLGDPVEKCLSPFLRTTGHTAVDLLVLSHANLDHYGGAADAVRTYDVGEVLVGPQFAEHARRFATGRETLDELAHLDRPPRVVRPGDAVPLGRATTLTVLWPPADAEDLESNDASLVVRLEHAGRRVLFTGDIQGEAMTRLLTLSKADPDLLRADVLVAPHHGSSEPETAAFVSAVDPAHVVSSNGRSLSQKQVRLTSMLGGRPLLRTSDVGAITVEVSESGELSVGGFLEDDARRGLHYSE